MTRRPMMNGISLDRTIWNYNAFLAFVAFHLKFRRFYQKYTIYKHVSTISDLQLEVSLEYKAENFYEKHHLALILI